MRLTLSVVTLSVVMLSVVRLSVVRLSVVKLSVVKLGGVRLGRVSTSENRNFGRWLRMQFRIHPAVARTGGPLHASVQVSSQ